MSMKPFTFVVLTGLSLSACTFETAFEHSDMAAMSCADLKTALASGQALQRKIEREGASPLDLQHGGEKPDLIERVATRLMIWGSGGQEAAEQRTAESFANELMMLKSELRRRCR